MDIGFDIATGILLINGYPFITLKMLWCYFLGGLGAIISYIKDKIAQGKKIQISGLLATFFMSVATIYLVIGFLDYFIPETHNHPYLYFVLGYFNRYVNSWVEANAEKIINKIFNKGVAKHFGVEVEEGKDKGKESSDEPSKQ